MTSQKPPSDQRYLVLRLKAALQAWGLPSRHDNKPTSDYPGKSAIVGLLGCALGIDRGDEPAIAELANLKMSVVKLKEGTIWTDYQTVGGGTDESGWLLTAEGKRKGHPAVTHRQYLAGADFAVVVEGDAEIIGRCVKALVSPENILFLGRKCCIPEEPILAAVCSTEEEVMAGLRGLGAKDGMECIEEATAETFTDCPTDVPVRFGSSSKYARRFVRRTILEGIGA